MSIVLSILQFLLQFLGWVLLILLLAVVVVLLIVLFCPVHYLLEGEWLEEKWAKFRAHWLLHLIRAKVSYGDNLIYGEVHLFWKKITFSHDLSEKAEEAEAEIEDSLEDSWDEAEEVVFVEELSDTEEGCEAEKSPNEEINEEIEEIKEDINDAKPDDLVSDAEATDVVSDEKIIGTETAEELRGEEPSVEETEVHSDVTDDESNSEESMVSKIKGILERIKEIYAKVKHILTDEQNKKAVQHLKNEVIYLIKIFIPKKSKIDAVFSTGSPDTTGQLFGVLACFPVMYRNDWKLVPDFQADSPYFKGSFWCKGWIAGYQFVGIVLRILFDKNCRRLYTMIRKFLKWIKKEEQSQEEK